MILVTILEYSANEIATLKAKLNELHELNNKLTALIERSLGANEDKPERKQRTKITDEVISEVLKMIDAGKQLATLREKSESVLVQ